MPKHNLVICGGGPKGLVMLGILQKLYEKNVLNEIDKYCGTSVGAIISFFLLIGYTPIEIFYVIYKINIDDLLNVNIESLFGKNSSFGLYSSDPIIYIIKSLMKVKGIPYGITFKELYDKLNKSLIVTGVCLNDNTLHFFDVNNYPNMSVLTAIRISFSIPLMFESVMYEGKTWVDGGCLCNYPIEYFENSLDDTIGINIRNEIKTYANFDSIKEFVAQLMKCITSKNKTNIDHKGTIYCAREKNSFEVYNFLVDKNDKLIMYNSGYNTDLDNFMQSII